MLRFATALLAVSVAALAPLAASAACPHFAGKWTSDFGPMTLAAKPIKGKPGAYVVSGSYVWRGTSGNRITGTLNGKRFFGRWIQPDRWGYAELILSPDETGFGGTWTEANHGGGGRWNGNCTS